MIHLNISRSYMLDEVFRLFHDIYNFNAYLVFNIQYCNFAKFLKGHIQN